jgi:hypothetical protein
MSLLIQRQDRILLLTPRPQMLTGKARRKRGKKSRWFRIDSRKAKMTPKGIKERKRQQKVTGKLCVKES